MKRLAFVLLFCFVLPAPVSAQDGPATAPTPESVVTAYFDRVKRGGFGSIADLMHPGELACFREMMGPVIEVALEQGDDTFADFSAADDPRRMREMDDITFMNTFMSWVSRAVPGIGQALEGTTVEALGHVVEGDVKHVVVRATTIAGGLEMERMSVMSVKDHEGRPMLMLTGDIKGLAEQLRRQLGN